MKEMGGAIVIILTCQGQIHRHEQRIAVWGYDLDGAKQLARLLDGTDESYINSPRDNPDSFLAHCRSCGAVLDATVEEDEYVEAKPA